MKTTIERFLRCVDKAEDKEGCWLWTGSTFDDGYGAFFIDGNNRRAHRVSYVLHVGEIPSGALVCHRCDVPRCVNPSHLFLGSNADNMADKVAKGRQARGVATRPETRARGERCGLRKLTEADVLQIRASDMSFRELGRRFGVDRKTIRLIVARKTWAHVKGIPELGTTAQSQSTLRNARGVDGAAAIPRSENDGKPAAAGDRNAAPTRHLEAPSRIPRGRAASVEGGSRDGGERPAPLDAQRPLFGGDVE